MTNTDFKAFLSWTYTPETLAKRRVIIDDLVRYVLRGAEHPYNKSKQHPRAAEFTDAARSKILTAYEQQLVKMPKKYKPDEGDTNTLVLDAFAEARNISRMNARIACPTFTDAELVKDFCRVYQTKILETWKEPTPSVQGAYEMAVMNLTQAETRLVALRAVRSLLQQNEFRNEEFPAAYEISLALGEQHRKFLMEMVLFAGLVGGDVAKDGIRQLAEELCVNPTGGIEFSVIQFLKADGHSPGWWSSKTEEALRKDIMKKYKALLK